MAARLLVIDASLAKRLSTELKKRGRPATTVAEAAQQGLDDPALLPALHERLNVEWTLVTGDDAMPREHGEMLASLRITVATIDPRWEYSGLEQEQYKREVVHRWAHRMAEQASSEIRRYSLLTHRVWTPLRR